MRNYRIVMTLLSMIIFWMVFTMYCFQPQQTAGLTLSMLPILEEIPAENPLENPLDNPDKWHLIFNDEFNGKAIDTTKWTTCYWWVRDGCTNTGNNELEWYQPDNVIVNNGTLKLQAQKRAIKAYDGSVYDYTSGMVTTGRNTSNTSAPARFLFKYGFVEVRAKVPAGQGLWPAIWLLPATQESKPEIDMMEILGDDPHTVHMHVHYLQNGNRENSGQSWRGPDFSSGWHTFAINWEPDKITWFVDGRIVWQYTDAVHISQEPMYLIANLAVGGDWPGDPDSNTQFPNAFEIDYVRIWQRAKPFAFPFISIQSRESSN